MRSGESVGRFLLRRVLGEGAQSTVWLAFDPRLEREVAIKIMRVNIATDAQTLDQWLQEARNVSKVSHPHIVPVFEADIAGQRPYLVFEYVPGRTLEALSRERDAMGAHEAVTLMMDVLDAMAVAHDAGVVHRDLKPSNVLVDAAGRARVTDFGIAAQVGDVVTSAQRQVRGTIGYLSPEAAQGLPPAPSMDIFSAGVLLLELLLGHPLANEANSVLALEKAAQEPLKLPESLGSAVDDALRSILLRALAFDADQRYRTAREFQAALESWAQPADLGDAVATDANQSSTLAFLLRRMRHMADFPALSDAVVRIQSLTNSETESIGSITTEILKDIALTNKLLRLVNSAHYARGTSISTVSRAVSLVGFNGIRNMALSLVLLEHMQDKAHAVQIREEYLRALMAGTIASELCPVVSEAEGAFIGALFQNLGRLLVLIYFPEEARTIRSLVQASREPMTEAAAAHKVLGLGFESLGLGVAKAWGLPAEIQRNMRKPAGTPPGSTSTDVSERSRWMARAANEMSDTLLCSGPEDVETQLAQVHKKFTRVLGVATKDMEIATRRARHKLIEMAAAMELRVSPGSDAARLLRLPQESLVHANENRQEPVVPAWSDHALRATETLEPAASKSQMLQRMAVTETLMAGIQDVTNAMVDDFKLSDILRMILETMFRALAFDRIIFCMRDSKTDMMAGRFGLGEGVEAQVKVFRSHLKAATPDLFTVVCINGSDTLISDASDSRIVQRLPLWYREVFHAPTFLLLPLQIKGSPFGLIYADKAQADALELNEKELALLRTLRNQAIMAFKQSN